MNSEPTLIDINPGSNPVPLELTEFDGKLFFSAISPGLGRELYVTDGTATGTQLVADINPGEGSSSPSDFTAFAGKLFFFAEGEQGRELYATDGTAAGTQLAADIRLGEGGSRPSGLIESGGKLFFAAVPSDELGPPLPGIRPGSRVDQQQLFASDGTAAGTRSISNIAPLTGIFRPTESDGKVFSLSVNEQGNRELLAIDSGSEQTQPLAGKSGEGLTLDLDVVGLTDLQETDGKQFFTAGGELGFEPYVTDGTVSGTQLVADIRPGELGSFPVGFTDVNGTTFFRAAGQGPSMSELYATDGTAAGTQLVEGIESPSDFIKVGEKLFFSAEGEQGRELYVTGGTATGAQLVADLNLSSNPIPLTEVDGKLLFRTAGQLYITNGTAVGTQLLADSNIQGAFLSGFTETNGKLFFTSRSGGVSNSTTNLYVVDLEATPPGNGNNEIFGTEGADEPLVGTNGDDSIFGLGGIDQLEGLNGNDLLVGGQDNDQLIGGNGNDTLIGTDDAALGLKEVDRLTGGTGQDRFILGNNETSYYFGDQWRDLAVIKDFTVGEDVVVLHGSAEQYGLIRFLQQNATRLYSLGNGTEAWDEIALFEGTTALDLASSSFEFITKNEILGTEDADEPLRGTNGDDSIFGLGGTDKLEGLDGNDSLIGGRNNDQLEGGNGNDTLVGTDDVALGQGEVDLLTGGAGQDRFVLGNNEASYYFGDDWFGLAVLKDFTVGEDVAVLHGAAEQYALQVNLEQNATRLYRFGAAGEPWDEVALFEGNTDLNLASASFEFIS